MPVFSAGGLGAFAVTSSGNQGIEGTKTFSPLTVGSTAIVVRALSGQTANVQTWTDNTGTVKSGIRPDGSAFFGGAEFNAIGRDASQAVTAFIESKSSTIRTLILRGAASQSANMTEWQDASGNILSRVGGGGGFIIGGPDATSQMTNVTGYLNVQSRAAGNQVAVLRGAPSQTLNVLQLENSAGTVIGSVGPSGNATVGPGQPYSSRIWYANNGASNSVATTIEVGFTGAAGTFCALELYRSGNNNVNEGTSLMFSGLNSSNAPVEYAGLNGRIEANTAGSHSGYLSFLLSSAGTARIERARMTSAGNFLLYNNAHMTIGPNSTWNASLRIGGNGHTVPASTPIASIVTTNGNLHIDGGTSGSGIYHNWYAGSTSLGTYFGNGQATQVGYIDRNGNAAFVSWTSTSRLDSKREIERVLETGPEDEKLMSLSAVKYRSALDDREDAPILHSFVAEEVNEIMPEIVTLNADGAPDGINMTALVTILTTQVQNLTARVRELEGK